jgi:hypothetical protein
MSQEMAKQAFEIEDSRELGLCVPLLKARVLLRPLFPNVCDGGIRP